MNWENIFTVYRKELRDSLRDRRTLLSTIIIPTVVMPLMFYVSFSIGNKINQKNQAESSTVMMVGEKIPPAVVSGLSEAMDEDRTMKLFRLVPSSADYRDLISNKKVRAGVQLPDDFESALKEGKPTEVKILNYQNEPSSQLATSRLQGYFGKMRDKTVAARLLERGLPGNLVTPFEVKRENVAPPEKVGGAIFGGLIPYVIIILCFTGAMYPGIDLTAGEKERGTMETLLCSPAARVEIVLGKFLMVLTGSLSAVVFSLISMAISFSLISSAVGAGAGAGAARSAAATSRAVSMMPTVDPLGIFGVLATILPVAVLFAAIIFTVALFAKSYKEAQSYVAPMIFVIIMPAMMGMLPGIELNAKLALVPILNLSLVCKEMLSGVWHWNYIALIFGSSCVYAAAALALAVKMFNREEVIFRV